MSTKRHDEIVRLIEELIKSGRLKAGERIPSERQLSGSFKVSRNTVREAIKALTEKAVLQSRRGSGTYVAEGALACMIDGAARRQQRVQEILELRSLLEPQIAALAARRINADELAALEDVVLQQRRAVAGGRDQVGLDELFHRLIARATCNTVLFEVYEALHEVLAESRVRELQSPERNRRSLDHHAGIVEALREHSPAIAAERMRIHMEQVEKNLQDPTAGPRARQKR